MATKVSGTTYPIMKIKDNHGKEIVILTGLCCTLERDIQTTSGFDIQQMRNYVTGLPIRRFTAEQQEVLDATLTKKDIEEPSTPAKTEASGRAAYSSSYTKLMWAY
ncbi:hypothetical protein NDU88_004913 [Pleurodeles waltl]|uniref:Uncharacterized protein n=1 Tax=Pleurodeles waltl TaxID=8319 RepID=A0AAV7M915_PLEWA|nr:hypothetical protein NDU88_004913 [Pleurodeles waltl]